MQPLDLTPALLTFCFVKDAFDSQGDLMLGLSPLFAPVAQKLAGRPFNPSEFSAKVAEFYGMNLPPAVAEEFAHRLASRGLLRTVNEDRYTKRYHYLDAYGQASGANPLNQSYAEGQIDALMAHVRTEFAKAYPGQAEFAIEKEVLTALATMTFHTGEPLQSNAQTDEALEARLRRSVRIIVADYVIEARASDANRFRLLQDICGGALLSQIILTVKHPPSKNIAARQLTVYFDTPLIVQYFGFDGPEKQASVKALIDSLQKLKASWGVYQQNVDEMRRLLTAITTGLWEHGQAEGDLARRITANETLRTRAREFLSNTSGMLKKHGFKIYDLKKDYPKLWSRVPNRFEKDLTALIRPEGKIESREVDASTICDTIRISRDRRTSDYLQSFVLFVSANSSLVNVTTKALKESGYLDDGEIPYILTDTQLAGLLWVALGAGGTDLPAKTLIANCIAALTPDGAIIERMKQILRNVDAEQAKEFEAIIAEDRCAYFLTKVTSGDAVLVTSETGAEVLRQLRQRATQDIREECEAKHAAQLKTLSDEHEAGVTKRLLEQEAKHSEELERLAADLSERVTSVGQALAGEQERRRQVEDRARARDRQLDAISGAFDAISGNLLARCHSFRRKCEMGIVIAIATLIGAVAMLLSSLSGLGPTSSAFVGFLILVCGTIGFHSIPEVVFGPLIRKVSKRAFIWRARSLGIEELATKDMQRDAPVLGKNTHMVPQPLGEPIE